jgi:glutamate N-acetyltransferase/amino-acid N-acetyltransferase
MVVTFLLPALRPAGRAGMLAARRGLLRRAPAAAVVSAAMSTYASEAAYLASLAPHAVLPKGFRVGTHSLEFRPKEVPDRPARMTLTLLALDEPTDAFAAMFTSNSFPGAPIHVGRARLRDAPTLQAVVVNNKISNVCAPGGVADSEAVCAAVASALRLPSPALVLPSSTGIIGWKLPVADMVAAAPAAAAALQGGSILPAAHGICTTDMNAKVRSSTEPGCGGGRIVGIAKGAGMIEPNLATMLVYILTDIAIPRDVLRAMLPRAVAGTFNALSIDSDQSTSDTVVALSSRAVPAPPSAYAAFEAALTSVCASLSEDIVRNGEGVQHVIRVRVKGAPTQALARAVGKSIVNSPLFKCAVAGNDPNVGRLVAAIGKCVGVHPDGGRHLDLGKATIDMGGLRIFAEGQFKLTPAVETALVAHMKAAQLWGECGLGCLLRGERGRGQ